MPEEKIISSLKPDDKNVGYKILKILYETQFEGKRFRFGPFHMENEKKIIDQWDDVLREMKNLKYVNYQMYRSRDKEFPLHESFVVAPEAGGILCVERMIEAEQRRNQNRINITLTVIIVLLTALNIWLSIRQNTP